MSTEIKGKYRFNENIDLVSVPSCGWEIDVKNFSFFPDGHPTDSMAVVMISNENILVVSEIGWMGVLYENGTWVEGYDRVVDMGSWVVDIGNWFAENATRIDDQSVFTPAITYNDTIIPIEAGKAITLHTSGQKLTDDVVIDTGKDSIVGTWRMKNVKMIQDKLEPNIRYRLPCKVTNNVNETYLVAFIYYADDGTGGEYYSGLGINLRLGYQPDYESYGGCCSAYLGNNTDGTEILLIEVLSDEADEEAKSWLRANATKQ